MYNPTAWNSQFMWQRSKLRPRKTDISSNSRKTSRFSQISEEFQCYFRLIKLSNVLHSDIFGLNEQWFWDTFAILTEPLMANVLNFGTTSAINTTKMVKRSVLVLPEFGQGKFILTSLKKILQQLSDCHNLML